MIVESRGERTQTTTIQKHQHQDLREDIDGYLTRPSISSLKGAFAKGAFVVGSCVLITICLRNSLTWHLARIWGGCREYVWQNIWDKVLDSIGDDPFILYGFGTFFLTNAIYFSAGSLYTYMDFSLANREYKVQPGTNEPIDKQKFWKMFWDVVYNQTVIQLPFNLATFYAMQWRGIPDIRELPSFHTVILELIGFLLVEEVLFYYTHWALHHRRIYKYIHKKHHEWTAAVAFISLYSHPLEHLLSNLVPVAAGPFLFGSHLATMWLWFTMGLLNTLNSHSGYHLPFFPSPEQHDFHHLKFTQCYGVLGILDYLHGTDTLFRESVNYDRNITVLETTPVRELIPDKKKM